MSINIKRIPLFTARTIANGLDQLSFLVGGLKDDLDAKLIFVPTESENREVGMVPVAFGRESTIDEDGDVIYRPLGKLGHEIFKTKDARDAIIVHRKGGRLRLSEYYGQPVEPELEFGRNLGGI